jgi:hypothetical protein
MLMVFGGLSENWVRSRESGGGVIKAMRKHPWRTLDVAARCIVALALGSSLMLYAILGHL